MTAEVVAPSSVKRRWTIAVAAALAVGAAAMIVSIALRQAWSSDVKQAGPSGGDSSASVSCDTAVPSCQRLIADIGRRHQLTAAEVDRAQTDNVQITELVSSAAVQPGDARSAEDVRVALTGAGYQNPTVRIAGEDDIGPSGALVAAIPVGPACAVAIRAADQQSSYVLGQYPDGTCLAD